MSDQKHSVWSARAAAAEIDFGKYLKHGLGLFSVRRCSSTHNPQEYPI